MNCNNSTMFATRLMEKADIGTVVELMVKAFQNAALCRYFEAYDEKRPAFLRMIFSRRIGFGFDSRNADLATKDGSK